MYDKKKRSVMYKVLIEKILDFLGYPVSCLWKNDINGLGMSRTKVIVTFLQVPLMYCTRIVKTNTVMIDCELFGFF